MAVSAEVTLVGVANVAKDSKRKNGRRRARKSVSYDGSSTCTASSSSSDSDIMNSAMKPRRRAGKRRAKRSRKNKPQEHELTEEEQSQYVALDCEMVGVGRYGSKSAIARVTMVGWNGEIVLDEFVTPEEDVVDYRTFVSGITKDDLDRARMTLEACRKRILEILKGKTLVGHALKNDLKALGISHPWYNTRDTAKYEPFMQVRFEDGILWPRKLKQLASEKLKREIQVIDKPHSAYEDAVAAMDLYRTVRNKWEKAMDYKIKKTKEIQMKSDTWSN